MIEKTSIRYYLYVSDEKVDMLAAQVPEKKLRKIARGLEIGIRLPWIPLGATYKPGDPQPTDATRISQLRVVEQAIVKEDIGPLDEHRPWIRQSLSMTWGFIDREARAVCFTHCDDHRIFVMGGSAKHLIGGVEVAQQPHHAYSVLPILISTLVESSGMMDRNPGTADVIRAVAALGVSARGPYHGMAFLAKRLMTDIDAQGREVVLASPLFVAMNA